MSLASVAEIGNTEKTVFHVSTHNAFKPSFFSVKVRTCTSFIAPYGTSVSRMPVNLGRQHGFMMDPHGAPGGGKLKVSRVTCRNHSCSSNSQKIHTNNVNICLAASHEACHDSQARNCAKASSSTAAYVLQRKFRSLATRQHHARCLAIDH